jgi:hypothetical protein
MATQGLSRYYQRIDRIEEKLERLGPRRKLSPEASFNAKAAQQLCDSARERLKRHDIQGARARLDEAEGYAYFAEKDQRRFEILKEMILADLQERRSIVQQRYPELIKPVRNGPGGRERQVPATLVPR